jgi:DNA-directed RNA polymerase subunit K/omega
MTDENVDLNTTEEPSEQMPPQPAPPVQSRFLFVDIAALRAKQLRRGALPRLEQVPDGDSRVEPRKPERIAMEEVRRGLVSYQLPDEPSTGSAS